MLLLSSDSGYNSPCGGADPSSSFEPPYLSNSLLKSKRRLCFAPPRHSLGSDTSDSNIAKLVSRRSREIAQRLIFHCDSFDDEFSEVAQEKQKCVWITATMRYLTSWL